jgi:hypothetical protein
VKFQYPHKLRPSRSKHSFILVRTTTKSIQFINKPVFMFRFFHVVVLVLLAKQQQRKIVNFYTISVCYAWALKEFLKLNNPPFWFLEHNSEKICSFEFINPVRPSTRRSVYLVRPSVCPSVPPSVRPSMRLSVCPPVCPLFFYHSPT